MKFIALMEQGSNFNLKILAEKILSRIDYEGHHYQVLTELTYPNRGYSAITKVDGLINLISGNIHCKRKTLGWKLLVVWKNGSVFWVTLNYVEGSNPVKLVEYSV